MNCYRCGVGLPEGSHFCLSCGTAQRAQLQTEWAGWSFFEALGKIVLILGGVIVVALIVIVVGGSFVRSTSRTGQILPLNRVIIDMQRVLKDGEAMSWKLPNGHYRLEMTASDDGCTVEWLGGNCPATQPMRRVTTECELQSDGQLIIRNPTTFGLGHHRQ